MASLSSNPKLSSQYNVYGQKKYRNYDNGNTRDIKSKTLTEKDLRLHTQGKYSVSYTFTLFVDIFGIDIDVKGNYLSETLRAREITALLDLLKIQLGTEPSLIFRSRTKGGIHCYYKLDGKYPFNLIGNSLKNIFKDYKKNIEILPTPTKPLRFPLDKRNGGMILNNKLEPIETISNNYNFLKEYTENAPVHNLHELIGIPSVATSYTTIGKNKREKINNATRLNRYYKYLDKIKPSQRETNEYISDMAFNGAINKIPAEIVTEEIIKELTLNNIYRDKDLTDRRIISRVKKHYERIENKNIIQELRDKKKQDYQLELIDKYEHRINKIFDDVFSIFSTIKIKKTSKTIRKEDITKRKHSLRKFLVELLTWQDYISSLTNYERQVLECHYKGFFNYTKKGLTPLPWQLMKNWYDKYNYLIPILIDKGYLKLEKKYFNPYIAKQYYSEIIGNCNYFAILF